MHQVWTPEHYYYRRNFTQVIAIQLANVAPHAITIRGSYSLGLDQALRVERIYGIVFRAAAAAPAAQAGIQIEVGGNILAECVIFTNGIGDKHDFDLGHSWIVDPASTINLRTYDISTGGLTFMLAALVGTVYSVL